MIKYSAFLAIALFLVSNLPVTADPQPPVCGPPPIYPDVFYPVTTEFYQQFMNDEIEFSSIRIRGRLLDKHDNRGS